MNEIIVLPLLFKMESMKFFIYPVVLKNKEGLTMIDCGYPNFLPIIEEAFALNNLDIKDLKQIVLTHCDHDHMGAVRELVEKYSDVKVICSEKQVPYITGAKKSLRLEQAEKVLKLLKGDAKIQQKKFIEMLKSVKPVAKVEVISDGEYLPMCDNIKVIETSGHMPGHISLYVEDNRCLISGNALIAEGGQLNIAAKEFVLDENEEIKSLKKLREYDIDEIICYHGGKYLCKDMTEKLNQIIEYGYL